MNSVIRFLYARNVLQSEIHHQICHVYGDNARSDGMVRIWVWMFNEGKRTCMMRHKVVNDDLVRKVNERVRDDGHFTISDLSLHFSQISRILLYDTVSSD